MLSISCRHPESSDFASAKLEQGKVTGANISVKFDDEFMKAVENDSLYYQYFPTHKSKEDIIPEDILSGDYEVEVGKVYEGKLPGSVFKIIKAKEFWDKIIFNAWRSAEPGVLFFDNILNNSSVKPYYNKGFKPISTNPCGEIPLCDADSCRLLHLNMYSFVDNPFTENAEFNWKKLEEMTRLAVDLLDDIVDLELEKVQSIINKIESDPEDESVKRTELELWKRIYNKGKAGRRLGLGTTADGDMVAAMGLTYGTQEANDFLSKVHKYIGVNSYMESILLAEERGSFDAFDWELEKDDYFVNKMMDGIKDLYGEEIYNIYYEKWKSYGRRNIASLTLAPTGCLEKSTEIITELGVMKMSEVFSKLGYDTQELINQGVSEFWINPEGSLKVPNMTGGLNKITKLFWKGKTLGSKVTLNTGDVFESTNNHKYLVKFGKDHAVWKEAKDLVPGDEIITLTNGNDKK